MTDINTQAEDKPAGVIDSLGLGFSLIARRPLLLLLPILLDLFLWLGPRLSLAPIASDLVNRVETTIVSIDPENTNPIYEGFERNGEEIFQSFNVFSTLSTWPLGVPSLLSGRDTQEGTWMRPNAIEIKHPAEFVFWLLFLGLVGLLLGCAYFDPLGRVVRDQEIEWRGIAVRIAASWFRIITLLLIVSFLSLAFFLVVQIVGLLVWPLATIILMVGIVAGVWLLFHLFFAVHGILVDQLNVHQAIRQSIDLVRLDRFSAVTLLVISNVINLGIANVCHPQAVKPWWCALGIVSNAFVNTGLAAASFVFYRERVPFVSDSASNQQTPQFVSSDRSD